MSDGADDAYRQAMRQEGEQLANPRQAIREELLELCANGVYSTEQIDALLLRYVLASAPVDANLRETAINNLIEKGLIATRMLAGEVTDAILALLPARSPEPDADAWMAICNETGGRLFAHTKERAEIKGREAYGKIHGHAGHAFEVVPLYAAANLLRAPAARDVPERFKHFAPDGGKPKMPEGWEGKIDPGQILDELYDLTGADDGERQSHIGGLLEIYVWLRNAKRPISEAPLDTAVIVYGFGYEVAHYNTALKAWVRCSDNRKVVPPKWWWPLPEMPIKEEML